MGKDPDRLQALMDRSYKRWRDHDDVVRAKFDKKEITEKEAREKSWGYEDFVAQCSPEEKLAVMIGNFNYQVCNGGFSQYHDNHYDAFADDLVRELRKVQNAKTFKGMPKVVALLETAIPFFNELEEYSASSRDCYCSEDDECYCDDTSDEDELYQQLNELDDKFYEIDKQFLVEAEMLFDNDLNYVGDQLEMGEAVKISKEDLPKLKPKVKLIGQDGNAFNLIRLTKRALEKAGLKEEAKEFRKKALNAGSYDKVIQLCMQYADVR